MDTDGFECWDGVDHDQILEWVNTGPGAALTERMEGWLRRTADALNEAVVLTQQAIRRLESGWSGPAEDGTAATMRVLRDFGDQLYFLSRIADITVYGQSSSAAHARRTVPPKVPVGAPPVPVGTPADIAVATRNYQDRQAAAKEAEQRARDLMRDYTKVTRGRIGSMRPLTPVPTVVLDAGTDPAANPGVRVVRIPVVVPPAAGSGARHDAGPRPTEHGVGGGVPSEATAPAGSAGPVESTGTAVRSGTRGPRSEPVEPETRDGVLVDPYRAGSRPPTIGADDDGR